MSASSDSIVSQLFAYASACVDALGDRELDALGSRKPGEERRRVERGRPQLEVRRAAERERSRAEKRTAQVGGAAAAARHDPPRRPLERAVSPIDHACRRQDSQGVGVAVDVELVAGRASRTSGAGRCGSPTGSRSSRRRENARRAAAPLPRSRWSDQSPRPAQVEASRRVEQRGQLRPPVALAPGRDPPELLAHVLRRDHRTTPSSASRRRLTSTPASP